MIATSARPTSQTPPMSSLRPGWLTPRGSERIANGSATRPIGTLMRKTSRQPMSQRLASMSAPARIGAPSMARPVDGPNRRVARPSSSSSKTSFSRPKPCGIIRAPKPPCRARKAMSVPDVRRHGASGREDGEAEQAEQEHPAAAEDVARAGRRRSAARRRPGCRRRSATGSCWPRRRARGGWTGRRRSRSWRRAGPWCWRPARRPPRSSAGRRPAPGRRGDGRRSGFHGGLLGQRWPRAGPARARRTMFVTNTVRYVHCTSARGVKVKPAPLGVAGLGGPRHEAHRAAPARLATARPRRR